MEKEDPKNPTEFTVPDKLKELYAAKDFGRYANARANFRCLLGRTAILRAAIRVRR